jgi:hypothetical protein
VELESTPLDHSGKLSLTAIAKQTGDVGKPASAGQPKWEIEVRKMYAARMLLQSKARLAQQECVRRECSPGHIDGSGVFYH